LREDSVKRIGSDRRMESTAFFEKKLSLTPSDFNRVKTDQSIEELLTQKAKDGIENKCSEQGFVLPGSLRLLSRSMGYFESARFTGDAVYYVKLEGRIIYPVDGIRVVGEVIRKNKMGLYLNYKDALRIQIPRDLHIGNQEYDQVDVGDQVEVELKRSKFAINDAYILASGIYLRTTSEREMKPEEPVVVVEQAVVSEEEPEDEDEEEDEEEEEDAVEEQMEPEEEEEEEEEEEPEEEEEEDLNQLLMQNNQGSNNARSNNGRSNNGRSNNGRSNNGQSNVSNLNMSNVNSNEENNSEMYADFTNDELQGLLENNTTNQNDARKIQRELNRRGSAL